jgi:hypothetical protein
VLLAGDVVILLGSFYTVSALYFGTLTGWHLLESGMLSAYLILPLYLTIALYNGTYSRRALTDWQATSVKALVALMLSAGLLNLLAFFTKSNAELSRLVFVVGLASTMVLIIATRMLAAHLIARMVGPLVINRLVILAGGPRFTIPFAYHVDATQHGLSPDLDDPLALDRLSKYLRNMDEVIVSAQETERARWSQVLKGTGIHGEVVHQLSRELGAIGVVHHEEAGISALKVSTGKLGMRARAAKRIFDLAVALCALIVLSPLLLVVALAIKLEDGGPVFFTQRRMGRGNELFDILKFRSMRDTDHAGTISASRDDVRVTRIGRIIRRTSVDELPQLINVLRGDMSNQFSIIRCEIRRFCVWRRCWWWCWPGRRGRRGDRAVCLVRAAGGDSGAGHDRPDRSPFALSGRTRGAGACSLRRLFRRATHQAGAAKRRWRAGAG